MLDVLGYDSAKPGQNGLGSTFRYKKTSSRGFGSRFFLHELISSVKACIFFQARIPISIRGGAKFFQSVISFWIERTITYNTVVLLTEEGKTVKFAV